MGLCEIPGGIGVGNNKTCLVFLERTIDLSASCGFERADQGSNLGVVRALFPYCTNRARTGLVFRGRQATFPLQFVNVVVAGCPPRKEDVLEEVEKLVGLPV